jgi:hypothetical protein
MKILILRIAAMTVITVRNTMGKGNFLSQCSGVLLPDLLLDLHPKLLLDLLLDLHHRLLDLLLDLHHLHPKLLLDLHHLLPKLLLDLLL